ncbi:RNA polymerase sigma factor [Chitinimonas lacunae]|uniref:RNA polymerase sigma factor n=1 Tax=Chitinimonas lacunae TaxID=1963018 RepID=A0ABV8MSE0_9NEIS
MSQHHPEETRWLELARRGDRAAFASLVRLHQRAVRAQLRRLCSGDDGWADELAQEVFVSAWLALPSFRGEARLGTWLYRISYHAYLQARRARPLTVELDEQTLADHAGHSDPRQGSALRLDMDRALAQLSEGERAALIHCYHLDLSHEEAAQVLGLAVGTVKTHIARGKLRLRQLLASWESECCI